MADGPLKARYTKLEDKRRGVLQRARDCAALTIPHLLPPDGHREDQELPTPHQALGARVVNNLAAKLLKALFPPGLPFFQMVVDDFILEEVAGDENQRASVEEALNKLERGVVDSMEVEGTRTGNSACFKHLVVTGNVLEYYPEKGGMRIYRLDQFCVRRDGLGRVLEIMVKEYIAPETIEDETLREKARSSMNEKEEKIDVYTKVTINHQEESWEVEQEVIGEMVPGSKGNGTSLDTLPWLALRWTDTPGEDYGRGLVEEYLGDFRSLEGLEEAILKGAAAAAKVVFMVDPNSSANVKSLNKAENGDFVSGNADYVKALQLDKFPDFRIALEEKQSLERRLSAAFMLTESIQRDAERVTAEEIRLLAGELEDSLGGVYTLLATEKQLPNVKKFLAQLMKRHKVNLPKEIKPRITTGFDALGRSAELERLRTFMALLKETLGDDAVNEWLKAGDIIKRFGAKLSLDIDGLVKSEEEVMKAREARQMQAMAMQLGKGPATELTKGMVNRNGQPHEGNPGG